MSIDPPIEGYGPGGTTKSRPVAIRLGTRRAGGLHNVTTSAAMGWTHLRRLIAECRASTRQMADDARQRWLSAAVTVLSAVVTVAAATPAVGQTLGPEATPEQCRLLVVSPTIALTDVGWDDNVFRVNKGDHPVGDFTATLSPAAQASLQFGRLNVTGRGRLGFIYFQRTSQINSIDGDGGGRFALAIGRFLPYVGGDYANARHDRNFEIDLPIRRINSSWNTGVDLRLSGKTSVGVTSQRSHEQYEGDTIFRDTDVSDTLGLRSTINSARIRYRATPLTSVGVVVEQDRSEFVDAAERNSDGGRVISVFEFQPRAAVSGTAHVGVRRRTFVDGTIPPFQGLVAGGDLRYTLLGRTQFAVRGQRDLVPSYRADQRDYLQSGLELAVTLRLGSSWDVGGTVGRFHLDYGLEDPDASATAPFETVYAHSVFIGYLLEKTTVNLRVERQTRTSGSLADRDYESIRILSAMSYRF